MVTVATSLPVENGREAGRLPRSSSAPLLLVGLSVFGGFQNSWGVQFLHDKQNKTQINTDMRCAARYWSNRLLGINSQAKASG